MSPKDLNELIILTDHCQSTDITTLIDLIVAKNLIEYKNKSINSRVKVSLDHFVRGKNIEDVEKAFLPILMSYEHTSKEKIFPVFTLPTEYQSSLMMTKSEMIKLITTAKKSIYVFGFFLTGHASEVIDALKEASGRGIKIIFIADSIDKFVTPLEKIWKSGSLPSCYVINKNSEHGSELKMHAKTIIIDECRLILTSANLTHYGLNKNVEFGVIIENRTVAEKICSVLSLIIHDEKYFSKI